MTCPLLRQSRFYEILTIKNRNSISDEKGTLLEINFEYPNISGRSDAFTEKFNSFYSNITENYTVYCNKKLIPKIKNNRDKQFETFKPFGEIMKFYITLNTEKYVSIVTDINHFNGYFTDCTRFSCVWNTENETVMPYVYFLETAKMKIKDVQKKVYEKIVQEINNGEYQFSYTEEAVKRYAKRINPKNFFLTEHGIAFWFEPGTLAPKNEGFPTYVIECNWLN